MARQGGLRDYPWQQQGREDAHMSMASPIRISVALLASAGLLGSIPFTAVAGDTRRDCQAWASATGAAKITIANRIGREQLLTKTHKLAELQPGVSENLYSSSDIQRLCHRY
jgi:hypothetical protein